jgi:hypothetical protein
MQRTDFLDALGARVAAGKFAREAFERAHHLQRLGEAGGVDARDYRAAVRQQLDQPFGREQLDRLA